MTALEEFINHTIDREINCAKLEYSDGNGPVRILLPIGYGGIAYSQFAETLRNLAADQPYKGMIWYTDGNWSELFVNIDVPNFWRYFNTADVFIPPIPAELTGVA